MRRGGGEARTSESLKSFNVRHIRRHLAAVTANVEGGSDRGVPSRASRRADPSRCRPSLHSPTGATRRLGGDMTRPVESAAVREEIARALRLDLVGPWAGHPLADEGLPGWVRPCNWYLTGFLVPRDAPIGQRGDADVDDEPEVAERAGLGDDSTEDRRAAKKGFFPSSMGLSFLVGEAVETLEVLVRWGDYRRIEAEDGGPDRDAAAPGAETEAGRDRQQTAGEGGEGGGGDTSGEGAGGEMSGEGIRGEDGGERAPGEDRGDDEAKAGTDADGASQGQARSGWQRTPRAETVRVALPATTGDPRRRPLPSAGEPGSPPVPSPGRSHPARGAPAGDPLGHPLPSAGEPGSRPVPNSGLSHPDRGAPADGPRGHPLPSTGDPRPHPVPNSGGLTLHAVARPVDAASFAGRIAPGTRSVSLFLVNDRIAAPDRERDEAFAFQAEIEVRSAIPFVPRPDPREVSGDDRDERVADLHYAHTPEYAAGHGVSADWELADGACRVLRTTWTPAAEVEKTETFDPPGAVLDMQALGALADGAAARKALSPLVTGYRSWIEDRRADLGGLADERRETAEELLHFAGTAATRMERGIRVLADDAQALDAFRTASRAVAAALSRRLAREGGSGIPPGQDGSGSEPHRLAREGGSGIPPGQDGSGSEPHRLAREGGSGIPPGQDGSGSGPHRLAREGSSGIPPGQDGPGSEPHRLAHEGGSDAPPGQDGPGSEPHRLAREGGPGGAPRWRAFQLAFLLLNLPGIADPADPEREIVDLLFFPTGGGKTEAYLGLARVHDGAPAPPPPGRERPCRGGGQRHHALHLAAADPRSARARGRARLRA